MCTYPKANIQGSLNSSSARIKDGFYGCIVKVGRLTIANMIIFRNEESLGCRSITNMMMLCCANLNPANQAAFCGTW